MISVPSLDYLHSQLAQQEQPVSQSASSLLLAYKRQLSSSSSAEMISENNYEVVTSPVDSKIYSGIGLEIFGNIFPSCPPWLSFAVMHFLKAQIHQFVISLCSKTKLCQE